MPRINNKPVVVESELSFQITGLCFKVHNKLGRFASERQYADELEELFKDQKIHYQREFDLTKFNADSPKGNRVDFIIENKLLLDLKAKQFITKEDYYQMQRYLKFADLHLGLIVNFRAYRLSPKRILNSDYLRHSRNNLNN